MPHWGATASVVAYCVGIVLAWIYIVVDYKVCDIKNQSHWTDGGNEPIGFLLGLMWPLFILFAVICILDRATTKVARRVVEGPKPKSGGSDKEVLLRAVGGDED